MMKKKIKYAVIGTGSNAEKNHITGYLSLPNVELVAVCDTNREQALRVAQKYGITKVYSDYKEMLRNEQLDIVSVCTPNFLHAEITIAALKTGANVHCEKPLAMNGAEARLIAQAKEATGKMVMVGLNNRFTNESMFLKQMIDQGLLGNIYQAKAGWVRRSGIPGRGTWFTNSKCSGGGVMIDLGVHYLDLVLYFMGLPQPSVIIGSTYQTFTNTTSRNRNGYKGNPNGIFDVEDSAVGLLQLENGASVNFEFSWASNIENDKFYYELLGTKGGASFVNGELRIFTEQAGTCIDMSPRINPNIRTLNEFQHFIDCIDNGKQPLAPTEDGIYMMDIIDAFYDASSRREPYHFNKAGVGV